MSRDGWTISSAWSLSHIWLFANLWTVNRQAPLSVGILQARILEWLPCPPPGDLSNPGIKPRSSALQADSLPTEPLGKPVSSYPLNWSLMSVFFKIFIWLHGALVVMHGFSCSTVCGILVSRPGTITTSPALQGRFLTTRPPGKSPNNVNYCVCVCAQLLQSCLTLCNPMDRSPRGSSVHGILQTRMLEWVAVPCYRGSSRPRIEPKSPALAGGFFTTSAT